MTRQITPAEKIVRNLPALGSILNSLPDDLRVSLFQILVDLSESERPPTTYCERRRRRDILIQTAGALYGGSKTARATSLARDLKLYAQGSFDPHNQPASGASEKRKIHWEILASNDGLPLAWRRIFDFLQ